MHFFELDIQSKLTITFNLHAGVLGFWGLITNIFLIKF